MAPLPDRRVPWSRRYVSRIHDRGVFNILSVVVNCMEGSLTCSECGNEVESTDDLEVEEGIAEIEVGRDGSVTLFENHDLFLCKGCKNPLGFRK